MALYLSLATMESMDVGEDDDGVVGVSVKEGERNCSRVLFMDTLTIVGREL